MTFGVYEKQVEIPLLERVLPLLETAARDLEAMGSPGSLQNLYRTMRLSTAMAVFHQRSSVTDAIYTWAYFSARENGVTLKSGSPSAKDIYRAMLREIRDAIAEISVLVASAEDEAAEMLRLTESDDESQD